MTTRLRHAATPLVVGALLLAVLVGCSDDGDAPAPPTPRDRDQRTAAPGSVGDVRADVSPQGYAALGCSLNAAQATLDPAELISRGPREAAYAATWSLLVAAGVRDDRAFGSLVEPASAVQQVHAQGDWDRVADERNAATRECRGVKRIAVGPHVRAAHACAILDRLAAVAPSVHDLVTDRVTAAADEMDAATHLARAAAADPTYRRLARTGARLQAAVAADAGAQRHAQTRRQMAKACDALAGR